MAHLPGQFTRGGSKILASDQASLGFGVSEADDPIWTDEGLRDLKATISGEGLEPEGLENFAPAHWYDVLLDGPRRVGQIGHLTRILRDGGGRGSGRWGTTSALPGSGGGARDRLRGAARARWPSRISRRPSSWRE